MPRTGQPSTRDVEATVRAVAVLDALAEGGELGTTDIARRTGISASTVSRQLGTLARLGLVEHVAATGRYRLGVRVLRLANAVLGRLNLRDVARPHLEELVRLVGEAGTLSIPGDGDAITVDFVPSDRYLQGVTRLGRPSIGHASSAGKVMLAFGNVPLPRGKLTTYAPQTITDPAALAEEIERVRAQGWAEAVEEREVGLSAVAAPVWSSGGELAAIVALQGPTSRFDEAAMRAAVPLLLECAKRISVALGFSFDARLGSA
jgi:DNA-binding IclR family transcriptional regulator